MLFNFSFLSVRYFETTVFITKSSPSNWIRCLIGGGVNENEIKKDQNRRNIKEM